MHYKDGTPAILGDIIQHDDGHVGIVIGGTEGSDFYSTNVVKFQAPKAKWVQPGVGYVGFLRDSAGAVKAVGSVAVSLDSAMQTREMVKIGHIDIGHG